jgi:hypothetical protein
MKAVVAKQLELSLHLKAKCTFMCTGFHIYQVEIF